MTCYCDYEPPDFSRSEYRTARKPHKCGECFRAIERGERYWVTVGKWDSDFSVFVWCRHCLKARETFVAHDECGCWAHGGFWDILEDNFREARKVWIGRMIVAKRKGWAPKYLNRAFTGPLQTGE